MLLGGLWHGAGWTFVVWGGLHGIYLGIDRAWRVGCAAWRDQCVGWRCWKDGWPVRIMRWAGLSLAWCLTFLVIALSWVIFRADSLTTAGSILRSAMGLNGTVLGDLVPAHGAIAAALFAIVGFAPNLMEIMHRYEPALGFCDRDRPTPPRWLTWNPKSWLGIPFGILMFFALQTLLLAPESEFLYFQF